MIEEQSFFAIKEVVKFLRVPKKSVKRRIESELLSVHQRLSKRGFEQVFPKHESNLEIMSSLPESPQLTLCEFEKLVIKRLQATAAGQDRKVSHAIGLLCGEFAQLRAEINTFNAVTSDDDSRVARSPPIISTTKERLKHSLMQPPAQALDFQNMNKAIGNE